MQYLQFCFVLNVFMVQAIYQALQYSASLGSCIWITPSGGKPGCLKRKSSREGKITIKDHQDLLLTKMSVEYAGRAIACGLRMRV